MRIVLHTSAIEMGGAERVLATMANHWAEKGWEITVLTNDDGSKRPFYDFHPNVRLVAMGTRGPWAGYAAAVARNIRRILRVRREMIDSKPDCVIAFGESNGVRCVLAGLGLDIPVIVGEHSDYADTVSTVTGKIWDMLRTVVYPHAARIVVLTQWAKDCFGPRVRRNITVIPDPVPTDWLPEPDAAVEADAPLPQNTIAGMGRFVPQKRFDLLIRAFKLVADDQDCSLVIVGDGPLRPELEELIGKLGLEDRVSMPGLLRNPWKPLRHASMFVLSSEFEPFGMVLVEAMYCGVPVISFDCPAGPRDIIRDGVDGILVPPLDVDALADAMRSLLLDSERRRSLAEHGRDVVKRFGVEKVMGTWETLIREVASEGSVSRSATEATPGGDAG